MQKIAKFAKFNFDKSDEDLIDELADYLDSQVAEIYNFFEVETPQEKVEIDIISTKTEYDKKFKLLNGWQVDEEVPKSARGCFAKGKILYLSIHDYKNTTHAFEKQDTKKAIEGYKKTLVHEYVHFVNDLFNKRHGCSWTEKFLVEGIATYLSHQKDEETVPFDFTLTQLMKKDDYSAYYLVTKYFVENYDKKYVLEVFQSSRMARELLTNELFDKAKNFYTYEKSTENEMI